MKFKWNVVLAVGVLSAVPDVSVAYETQTHGYLTSQAFDLSDFGNSNAPALLARLGIDRLDTTVPFSIYWNTAVGQAYYDNLPDGTAPLTYLRPTTDYEKTQMQQLAYHVPGWIPAATVESPNATTPLLPLRNWLVRGAIREDDLKPGDYNPKDGPAPDPDPRGAFERVFNHFYDPIDDIKLSPFGASCTLIPGSGGHCDKAVDFALGTADAFTSLSPDPARNNHFSWADARNNMFMALTAERDANNDNMRSASEREADAEERLDRWATTFRALGDVTHLLEDMAQPQHSRNDRHDPYTTYLDPERQAFEAFTNARLIGAANVGGADPTQGEQYVRSLNGLPINQSYLTPPQGANGYPAVWMTTPLRYFTTRLKSDTSSTDPSSRLGLADYTNRGFFTRGTLPDSSGFPYPPTPVADGTNGYTAFTSVCDDFPTLFGRKPICRRYSHVVPDLVQPSRSDATSTEPVVVEGMWFRGSGFSSTGDFAIGPPIFQVQADLAFPRAIGYSAGIINYFFRGNLVVTAPPDKIVAVLNQGAQHTMNAQGYPCVGAATTDGCPIFGFQSIRVNIQNMTPQITETGGAHTVAVQNMAATAVGSVTDPNFHGPYLVAVAKYHRNTCYEPDLSGEPYQIYNYTPPSTGITQPSCAAGQTTRTAYQEISVSKSFAATAAQLAANAPAFEAHFDFSSDPIPVNATDLFVQIVYRGSMGDANGQEPDAIAVGTLDVREPTFATFWNNTDYFWNDNWIHENSLNHNEGIESFWACMGGAPVKKVFEYDGAVGSPAMADPIVSSNNPGLVRLAAIFPPPDAGLPLQQKNVRAVPVHYAGDQLILQESVPTRGVFRQANLENVDVSTLIPYSGCATTLPTDTKYWCFDPIQRRRNQLFGSPFSPLYIDLSFDTASDVDSVPLPAFSGTVPLATGTNLFDPAGALPTCTIQPAAPTPITDAYQNYLNYLDTLEEARDLGVSGEDAPPLQQEVPSPQH